MAVIDVRGQVMKIEIPELEDLRIRVDYLEERLVKLSQQESELPKPQELSDELTVDQESLSFGGPHSPQDSRGLLRMIRFSRAPTEEEYKQFLKHLRAFKRSPIKIFGDKWEFCRGTFSPYIKPGVCFNCGWDESYHRDIK